MGTTRKRSVVGESHDGIRQFPADRVSAPAPGEAAPGDIVDQSPDVRTARVAELREQVLKGAYAADPREVAREILKRGL